MSTSATFHALTICLRLSGLLRIACCSLLIWSIVAPSGPGQERHWQRSQAPLFNEVGLLFARPLLDDRLLRREASLHLARAAEEKLQSGSRSRFPWENWAHASIPAAMLAILEQCGDWTTSIAQQHHPMCLARAANATHSMPAPGRGGGWCGSWHTTLDMAAAVLASAACASGSIC